ncbi:tRNA (N(6)-L-threonylcarbamoyladenosine(37)-C(2))-methylthiotransferase MtaB [Clostridium sp.]|uniref:tRNA (N(6)-L-threonylcarbamoyladenosine(37)-C(2))- methylthiotransferase MtaB n=1 Tax=Clostridium sp. TaxID=1506 RepID=UPI002FC584C4
MKVAFSTLGCRVNVYESEAMTEKFIKDGYEVVSYDEFSDVYVINTCTVTNMGDKKSRQMISRAKRKNPEAIVAVVGCYSQIASDEISQIEGVDVVLGSRNKGDIVYWVNRAREERKQVVEVNDVLKNNQFEELSIEDYQDKTRAFLKIQDGCNRFCSYCLIPFARGAVCSKSPEKVMSEVRELAKNGFKEIIISGVHTASYGVDLEGDWNLVRLLEEIDKTEGIQRIRIGSIDPTFFSEGAIDKIVALKKMCPHFHLSLQSGCNATLKRMNRHYTTEDYKTVVTNLRRHMPDVSITTDIIVGFPGETEEEFNFTYEFLSKIKLSKTHVFKYSPRKGTKAADMEFQVDGNIKEARSNKLIELNLKNEQEFMEKFLNTKMDVLYEEEAKGKENYYVGYTPNYIKVVTYSETQELDGKIISTKLIDVENENTIGQI